MAGVGRGSHQGHVAPPAGWRNIMNIVSDPEDYAGLDWLYKVPASAGDAILFTEVDTTSVHDRFYPFYFNGLVGIVLRLDNFCVIMLLVMACQGFDAWHYPMDPTESESSHAVL